MNWENIAKDYDAVHFDGPSENLRTTEVESTVILDPSKYSLKPIRTWETLLGAVKRERFGSANNANFAMEAQSGQWDHQRCPMTREIR